jgi:hypothetical protein
MPIVSSDSEIASICGRSPPVMGSGVRRDRFLADGIRHGLDLWARLVDREHLEFADHFTDVHRWMPPSLIAKQTYPIGEGATPSAPPPSER